jgi:ankyrin repeat protein
VHLRNRDGRTPLFLAAEAGIERNVELLKKSGAHLHADEVDLAILLLKKAQEASNGNNGGTNNGNGDANGNGNLKEARVRCWKIAGL